MSWQQRIYEKLQTRHWCCIGELFEAVETEIPPHYAMRYHASHKRQNKLPSLTAARWSYFLNAVSTIGVERDPKQRKVWQWGDHVRLAYLTDRQCPHCAGPVIRANWSGKKTRCLKCQPVVGIVTAVRPVIVSTVNLPPMPQPVPPTISPSIGKLRRILARFLKSVLPFSINSIERELERNDDNYIAVLAKHGKTHNDLMYKNFILQLMNRRSG